MNDSESKVKHGLLWLGTAGAAMRGIDLVSSLVILWLLSSEQMGLASLSWTVAVFIEAFNGLGVGVALVQAERLEDDEVDSLFWFTLGFGALVAAAVAALSPLIARAFGAPALAGMVAVSALRLLFMAGALLPMQLLQRNLGFKQIAAVQTLAAGLAACVKILLAALGFGAWALVIGHTGEGLFTLAIVYFLAPFWPRARFSFAKAARFVRFGLKAATSTIFYQGYRNLDFIVVGRAFGVSALGLYRVAFDVAMIPLLAILDVINRTAFPVYARIGVRDPERLRRTYLWMVRNLTLVTGPLAVLLFFVGPDILVLVSGVKWAGAAPMIRALVWGAFLRTLTQATPQLFHAAGRPELAAYDSMLTLPVFMGCAWGLVVFAGDRLGVNAVSWSWSISYLLMLAVLLRMTRSVLPISVREYVKNLLQPLGMMAALFACISLADAFAGAALPRPLALPLRLLVGVCAALAYYRWVLGLRLSNLLPRQDASKLQSPVSNDLQSSELDVSTPALDASREELNTSE